MRKPNPYVDYSEKGNEKMCCRYCGESEPLNLPMAISALVKKLDEFTKKHKGCWGGRK